MSTNFSHLANNISTTLASAHTSGDGQLVVVSSTGFPTAPFRVTSNNVIFNITSVSGTTFTIGSMLESTTDISLPSGTPVKLYFTAGHLQEAYTAINALETSVVHITGNETIAGVKTFSDDLTIIHTGSGGAHFVGVGKDGAQIILKFIPDSGTFPALDITFPAGSIFRSVECAIMGSANDMFFQAIPNTTGGYGYLETFNAAGMCLGTASGVPVLIRPNRVTTAEFPSGGGLMLVIQTAGNNGIIIQSASSQSANLTEWHDSVGGTLVSITPNGALILTSISDSAAPNNSLFRGSDHSNKLCYKDGSGTVNELY